eukprot:1708899-Pyramimonas_sp.AAC.1
MSAFHAHAKRAAAWWAARGNVLLWSGRRRPMWPGVVALAGVDADCLRRARSGRCILGARVVPGGGVP